MKRWAINGIVSGGKHLGSVEANTKEDAEKIAWETLDCNVYLCHQCSSEAEDAEIQTLDIYLSDDQGGMDGGSADE